MQNSSDTIGNQTLTFRLGALTQIPTLRLFDCLMLEVTASRTKFETDSS
jgi:hypothetical protein